ncbi:hypothetical protein [Sphingobium yanoikuyae]|uniref:hypothetical protein n=1 Tax=Sphingobium yanoikuyae TaxID=13690 RepID=UPI001110A7F6|nr:hypothetical protein [Sphingobium yanoikuyae]
MIRYIVVAAALWPSSAIAKPITLKCELDDRGSPLVMDVALDEDAGTASYISARNNMPVKRSAIFLPSTVSFAAFTIDRTSLAITREPISDIPSISGTCSVVEIKRAF